jgi:hypothetical protein
MKDNKESLEERAKEFFKSNADFNFGGLNPAEVDNLYEYLPEINYLVKNGYAKEVGDTVKTFRYASTVEGRKWAKS